MIKKIRLDLCKKVYLDILNFNAPEEVYLKLKEQYPTAFDENNPSRMLELYLIKGFLEGEQSLKLDPDVVMFICTYPNAPSTQQ